MSDALINGRSSTPAVKAGRWTLDPARSAITLRHKGMWGLATVKGAFARFEGGGEVLADGAAYGDLVITTASLDTGHTERDEHLRSAHFFDSAKRGSIVFKADSVSAGSAGQANIVGQLTVLGRVQPLSFTATPADASAEVSTARAPRQAPAPAARPQPVARLAPAGSVPDNGPAGPAVGGD
jgi:polyisoprenoid-binding protein YceI